MIINPFYTYRLAQALKDAWLCLCSQLHWQLLDDMENNLMRPHPPTLEINPIEHYEARIRWWWNVLS